MSYTPQYFALEPRLVFDQALVETALSTPEIAASDVSINNEAETVAPLPETFFQDNPKELFLIEETTYNTQFKDHIPLHENVIIYNHQTSLNTILQQIETLGGGLESVHIISHANDGILRLGDQLITASTLENSAPFWQSLGSQLTESADILFYGCNLAGSDNGQRLLTNIATLTQADIAASDDITGSTQHGGDATLEFQSGSVETNLAFDQAFFDEHGIRLVAEVTVGPTTQAANFRDLFDQFGLISLNDANAVDLFLPIGVTLTVGNNTYIGNNGFVTIVDLNSAVTLNLNAPIATMPLQTSIGDDFEPATDTLILTLDNNLDEDEEEEDAGNEENNQGDNGGNGDDAEESEGNGGSNTSTTGAGDRNSAYDEGNRLTGSTQNTLRVVDLENIREIELDIAPEEEQRLQSQEDANSTIATAALARPSSSILSNGNFFASTIIAGASSDCLTEEGSGQDSGEPLTTQQGLINGLTGLSAEDRNAIADVLPQIFERLDDDTKKIIETLKPALAILAGNQNDGNDTTQELIAKILKDKNTFDVAVPAIVNSLPENVILKIESFFNNL